MEFLNLDFVYVLPYCELSFCHRDCCSVWNYHILSKNFKSNLRFAENILCGLTKYDPAPSEIPNFDQFPPTNVGFCLGCSNKKCWVWFLALIFMPWTFLFFRGNHLEVIQPVKTSIFDCQKDCVCLEIGSLLVCFSQLELLKSNFLVRLTPPDISNN